MKKRHEIRLMAAGRAVVLDGATGTEMQARGMPVGACPELWCLNNPDIVRSIHRDFLLAGSEVIYTCTFGANRFKLSDYGGANPYEINRELASLARQAADGQCLVAGDIGPTGRFIEPFGDVLFEDAVQAFKEQIRGLMDGGADLFVIETMIDIQEARAALIAVREVCDAFTIVTMTYESTGRTLNGTDPLSALITLQSLGADAVGCNCSTGPEEMIPLLKAMQPHARVPLVAKPNAGLPVLQQGKTVFPMSPERFSGFAGELVSSGVRFLGGCCGTTPAHIRALKEKLTGLAVPVDEGRERVAALSSARKTVILDRCGPLMLIGERINPTGKKDLQEELASGAMSLVKRLAQDQVRAGASILDVNVGMPGIDEAETLRRAVSALSVASDAPLSIDSSVPEAIEKALRIYPGRALINSISGEEGKLALLLDIASRYGAMFILLPLTGRKLPKTSPERQKIIEEVYARASSYGFTKDDIVVDALTMAVSADSSAAVETIETTRWCSAVFGARTVLGLSNVSFGLPERRWINAAFVAMESSAGLTLAISNPMSGEFMNVKRASDVLMNRDPGAKAYIAHAVGSADMGKPKAKAGEEESSPLQKVFDAVLDGSRNAVPGLIDEALASGIAAQGIIEKGMIPAIKEVGDLYEGKVYFLPQLIASAESMKRGFEHIEPLLKSTGGKPEGKGTVLMATVQGDIHDIGKNIVSLMLRNHGFEVIDLGKDVADEEVVSAISRYNPRIVGLSALMTTTMVHMDAVIRQARARGLSCPFLVGGAVVTKAYADSIGAHYASDGVQAVKIAQGLIG